MAGEQRSSDRVGYRGYVTCRSFGGLQVPVPLQSLLMRDYCARNGFFYKLHVAENLFPNSYLVLEGTINELYQYEGLLATSMFMMPKRASRRVEIYEAVLAKGASLHFVLEEMVVRTQADISPIEEILTIYNLLPPSVPGADALAGADEGGAASP